MIKSGGKLKEIWIASGGKAEEFYNRLKPPLPELLPYHIDLLEKSQVVLNGNQTFLRMALGLLGKTRFEILLGEAKYAILNNDKSTKTPTHRLIHYIKEAVADTAKSLSASQINTEKIDVKKSYIKYKNNVDKEKEGEPKRIKENKEDASAQNYDIQRQEGQGRAVAFLEFWANEFKNICVEGNIPADEYKTWIDPLLEEKPFLSNFSETWIIENYFNASEEKVKLYEDFKGRKNVDLLEMSN